MNQDDRTTTILPVLPLDDAVVLPGTSVTFPVTSDEQAEALAGAVEGRILLVPRVEGRFGSYGVVAEIMGEVGLPDGTRAIALEARHRAELGPAAIGAEAGCASARSSCPTRTTRAPRPRSWRASTGPSWRRSPSCAASARAWRTSSPASPTPGRLADTAGYAPEIPLARKLGILGTPDVVARLRLAIEAQRERLADAGLRRRIREDVSEGLDKTQREMLLRRQLAAIRKELGDDDEQGDDWAARIEAAELPRPRGWRPSASSPAWSASPTGPRPG